MEVCFLESSEITTRSNFTPITYRQRKQEMGQNFSLILSPVSLTSIPFGEIYINKNYTSETTKPWNEILNHRKKKTPQPIIQSRFEGRALTFTRCKLQGFFFFFFITTRWLIDQWTVKYAGKRGDVYCEKSIKKKLKKIVDAVINRDFLRLSVIFRDFYRLLRISRDC